MSAVDQLSFEAVRRSDPDTSRDAIASLPAKVRGRQVMEVVDLIRAAGARGKTCDETIAQTGRDRGCTARRITDARRAGLVVDSGGRRLSRAGRSQIVWVAARYLEPGAVAS